MHASPAAGSQTDRLLVVGSIDSASEQVNLQPIFVIPGAGDLEPRTPGDYAIVLRNAGGDELARYPFSPDEVIARSNRGVNVVEAKSDILSISELVPYVTGTTLVAIEGPSGVMAEVSAGAASPAVTLTTPNGGETLIGDPVTITWTADDADGDPLTFKVQYSPNNGATWELVAQNITANSVAIPTENLVGGEQALFKVWVSDGIHTAEDSSDAPFSVPNRVPTVEILAPVEDTTVTVSQTLSLEGFAYDVDLGFMDDSFLEWRSDQDGLLGDGDQLSVSGLSVGVHTITFQADDEEGEVVTDTTQVTVVGDLSQLPPLPDALIVGPTSIKLDSSRGITSDTISIDNQNLSTVISWQATANEPWLELSHTSGVTPFQDLVVSFDSLKMSLGAYLSQVTFTSPEVPGQVIVIPVQAFINRHHLYLPLTIR